MLGNIAEYVMNFPKFSVPPHLPKIIFVETFFLTIYFSYISRSNNECKFIWLLLKTLRVVIAGDVHAYKNDWED